MKKVIILALLFLVFFAQTVISKPIHPTVLIKSLAFSEGQNGEKIAFSKDNPSLMYEFENPILCRYGGGDPDYGNRGTPICHSPAVFMGKGGVVKLWDKSWGNENLLNYEASGVPQNEVMDVMPSYYVVETPKSMYYCVYENTESSLCRLFPADDPNIKVGDQFASCVTNPISWATDKNGVFRDCDKQVPLLGRDCKFAVVGISKEGGIFLRGVTRYAIAAVSDIPLNENGRMDIMGSMSLQPNIFILVKLKENPKAKNSKTKKK